MEKNKINDYKLKINLGNEAINILLNKKLINTDDLKNTSMYFGYIFEKEDNSIEALYKIICNNTNYYFAFQKEKILLLNITNGQYDETVNYVINSHDCLKNIPDNETDTQKSRKIRNNQYLQDNNITFNDKLICPFNDSNIEIKNFDEICKRAIACLLTVQIACDINNGSSYKESLKVFVPLLKKYDVEKSLNSKEKRIIDGTYNNQDPIDMDWAYESYWALCWYLGLIDDIKDGSKICDCNKAISFVIDCENIDNFKNKCNIRRVDELLDMYDLYFRYNWAINNNKINPDTKIGNLNSSIVIERRRALEWIISSEKDWYNISLDA